MLQHIKKTNGIEFWFYTGEYGFRSFDSLCLYTALVLKSKFPQKSIKIVYVNNDQEADSNLTQDFPIWLCDEIYSPEIDTDYQYKNDYIQRKFQWLLLKMDYVYYYSEPYAYTQELKAIQLAIRKKPEIKAVSLVSPDIKRFVEEFLKQFSPRQQSIISLCFEGKRICEISKKLNIARQVISETRYCLSRKITSVLVKKRKSILYKSCYLTNLESFTRTKAAKLRQFLLFAYKHYNTSELWIDWGHCHLSYIQLIFKTFSDIKNVSINVLVNSNDKNLQELNVIKSKFPKVNSQIVQENSEQAYELLYFRGNEATVPYFIIVDLSDDLQSNKTKDFGLQNNSACLIDISKKSPTTH